MVFEVVHPDGKMPIVKTMYSAGLDFYSRAQVEIEPGKTVIIGLGVRSVFSEEEFELGNNQFFLFELRSSLRAKGLTALGSGIIDMDYQGEWKEIICNLSDEPHLIKVGDRIAQAVLMSHNTGSLDKYKTFEQRVGGLGSTGE